jgi:hypothetical protein
MIQRSSKQLSYYSPVVYPATQPPSTHVRPSPSSFPDPEKLTIPPAPTISSYPPEEITHYEEFTNFLDSLGLPIEWNGSESHNHNNHNNNNRTYPTEIAEPGLHPFFREQERDRSRAGSPYRSWLPSVPPGDHHQGYGMVVSDYGNMYHHYHPPEDIARVVVPNFRVI